MSDDIVRNSLKHFGDKDLPKLLKGKSALQSRRIAIEQASGMGIALAQARKLASVCVRGACEAVNVKLSGGETGVEIARKIAKSSIEVRNYVAAWKDVRTVWLEIIRHPPRASTQSLRRGSVAIDVAPAEDPSPEWSEPLPSSPLIRSMVDSLPIEPGK